MWKILYILPKNYLSYFLGRLAAIELPRPFSSYLVRLFAYFFKIDDSSASKPASDYRSIAEFFIRDLKQYHISNESRLISPVEGTLRSFGKIENGLIPQVKDIDFHIKDLLGHEQYAQYFSQGLYFNLYLSPRNYHQVHAPLTGEIIASTHIPGTLWPVNDWSLNNVKDLFCINERIVTYFDSELGKAALVMVGATNVGSMTVVYDNWITNNMAMPAKERLALSSREYANPIAISRGEKLGKFHLGSSVILLTSNLIEPLDLSSQSKIELFQALIKAN